MALVVGFPPSLNACYTTTHNPPFQHPTFLDTIHAVVYWIRSRFGERTCRFLMDMNGILLKLEGTGWVVLQYMLVQGTPLGTPPPPIHLSLALVAGHSAVPIMLTCAYPNDVVLQHRCGGFRTSATRMVVVLS